MKLSTQIIICLVLIIGVISLEYYTDIDLYVADSLYNFGTKQWFIPKPLHLELSIIFYKGAKIFTALIATIALGYLVFSKKNRKPALTLLLCIAAVTGIISGIKTFTNVYCPYELERYGRTKPFVRIIENYPAPQPSKGHCFPAGHATAGFSLMALYFCFNDRKKKLAGLFLGVSLGAITGTYQMLRGEHFLSHTLCTMILSWMIILIVNEGIKHVWNINTPRQGFQKRA